VRPPGTDRSIRDRRCRIDLAESIATGARWHSECRRRPESAPRTESVPITGTSWGKVRRWRPALEEERGPVPFDRPTDREAGFAVREVIPSAARGVPTDETPAVAESEGRCLPTRLPPDLVTAFSNPAAKAAEPDVERRRHDCSSWTTSNRNQPGAERDARRPDPAEQVVGTAAVDRERVERVGLTGDATGRLGTCESLAARGAPPEEISIGNRQPAQRRFETERAGPPGMSPTTDAGLTPHDDSAPTSRRPPA